MKVVLFGATGKTGLLVTKRALASGHLVTVYVRNPAKLGLEHDRLRIVQGELNDGAKISALMEDQEAVISLLGPSGRGSCEALSAGVQQVIGAMQRHGVRRLIAISTASAVDPLDGFSLSFWLAIHAIHLLQPDAWKYFVQTADLIRNSGLDWTLVRLGMLTDKECGGQPELGYVGDAKIRLFWLSRNALADFLVGQLQDRSWIARAPAISNPE